MNPEKKFDFVCHFLLVYGDQISLKKWREEVQKTSKVIPPVFPPVLGGIDSYYKKISPVS
jgi:hypothetical protein